MEDSLNKGIHLLFLMLVLNIIAVASLIAGLGMFGVIATYRLIFHLYRQAGSEYNYRNIDFRAIPSLYKAYLKETWLNSSLKMGILLLLVWFFYITSQMTGLLFFMSMIIQGSLAVIVITSFLSEALLYRYFEGTSWEFFKLSFIQFFLSAKPNIFNLLYLLLFSWLLSVYPAVSFLIGFAAWVPVLPTIYLRTWQRISLI